MIRIALDGPGGAGKSYLARQIAASLGIVYLDTGALYRTVGLYVCRMGADPTSAEAVTSLLDEIHIDLKYEGGEQQIYLNGENTAALIRTPQMSMYASAVSAIPSVRAFLLEMQKNIARTNSVIMDGRDIGTVIMPDADVKIFLTASPEARAQRRLAELTARGEQVSYADVLNDIIARDSRDSGRAIAPAVPAEDAIILDNSGLTREETVAEALRIIRQKLAENAAQNA